MLKEKGVKMDYKKNKDKLIMMCIALAICILISALNKEETISPIENGNVQEQVVENISNEEHVVFTQPISPPLKVYFLDVGQGDCIFVENDEETLLIDAGNNPDGKYISKYLKKELGIKKIDYLIGTHAHEDHIGGTDIIIEDFEIGTFYMPTKTSKNKCYTDIISLVNDNGMTIVSPEIGTKFNVGKAECEVMTQNDNAEDYNETSIVIEMTFGSQKFLFTGDMETENEESRDWNDIDVLKVAHHGSTYTTSAQFLNEVKPEIAVIMCGKDNDYYYPHEKLIERLENIGCDEIHITADEGTILITSDGISSNVETFKNLSFDGNK